mmetsp:Transcript_66424/g.145639  ORF Transcript_66424/g.145639 Transcript_66424/m.145639 type:complete len:286 (+) Transcript_66424:555-1412(+)
MSSTSSMENISTFVSASSTSFFSFLVGLVLKLFCFACHSWNCFCQEPILSVKLFEGCKSSIRVDCFASKTHLLKYSLHSTSPSQTNSTESNPSDSSGIVKLDKLFESAAGAMSPTITCRKSKCNSSSESSTFGGSSPKPSSSSLTSSSFASTFSSLASSFSSSSSSFTSFFISLPSSFFSSPAFFMASSNSFFLFSSAFLRNSASSLCRRSICFCCSLCAFLSLHSLSAFACFSRRILVRNLSLNSSVGFPMITMAVFLKWGKLNLFKTSARSEASRFALTSITT